MYLRPIRWALRERTRSVVSSSSGDAQWAQVLWRKLQVRRCSEAQTATPGERLAEKPQRRAALTKDPHPVARASHRGCDPRKLFYPGVWGGVNEFRRYG